ncbi:GGDEF domain-containing protein [Thiobacillus denitrificans]|uniref:GGDEF domain-containing protein n=1 Tax=Thiobacillus denitrificans TaxID=36861 RepID=UPI0000463A78|nr:GGDEF domain-containing protein [Thiobacillus denitrificans]
MRRHFVWLLLGVVLMLVGGVGLSLWFSLKAERQNRDGLLRLHAESARDGVKRRLDHYRSLVDKLARDPELEDLLRFGGSPAPQDWVQSRQPLIPDLHGLTLLTPEGEVLGDGTTLRIGPDCRAELRSRQPLRGRRLHLQRGVGGRDHLDLVSAVRGVDNELLGGVLLSMRLDALKRILEEAAHPGQTLTLLDAAGKTVVSNGEVADAAHEVRLDVGEGGWTLVGRMPGQTLTHSGKAQLIAGGATLLAVLLLLQASMLHLRRAMLRDIDATRDALTALAHGEPVQAIVPHYVEFAPTAGEINLIALQLQAQREQLEHLSLTDPLTGLPNRRAFETRFPQALGFAGRGLRIALVLLDIDYFKRINDSFGHGVGDQVLLALAQTLKALTRRADLPARLAGDEFVILLADLDTAGVALWYRRLADHFRSELAALGLDIQTGISAGQTWLRRTSRDTMNDALGRADRALYQAKASGRNQIVIDAPLDETGAG